MESISTAECVVCGIELFMKCQHGVEGSNL